MPVAEDPSSIEETGPLLCPICRRAFVLPAEGEKSTFPFCSDRCRTIDLARWLDGKYQIPVVEKDESDADGETTP